MISDFRCRATNAKSRRPPLMFRIINQFQNFVAHASYIVRSNALGTIKDISLVTEAWANMTFPQTMTPFLGILVAARLLSLTTRPRFLTHLTIDDRLAGRMFSTSMTSHARCLRKEPMGLDLSARMLTLPTNGGAVGTRVFPLQVISFFT